MGALKTQPAPTVSLPPAAARPRPIALSPHLDCFEAVAALLVVAGHARGLFLVSAPEAGQLGPVAKAVYFLTGFGHQAVLVFFVLSGLLISRKVVDQVSRDTWSW